MPISGRNAGRERRKTPLGLLRRVLRESEHNLQKVRGCVPGRAAADRVRETLQEIRREESADAGGRTNRKSVRQVRQRVRAVRRKMQRRKPMELSLGVHRTR